MSRRAAGLGDWPDWADRASSADVLNVDQRYKFGVAIADVVEMSVRAKASANLKVTVSGGRPVGPH